MEQNQVWSGQTSVGVIGGSYEVDDHVQAM